MLSSDSASLIAIVAYPKGQNASSSSAARRTVGRRKRYPGTPPPIDTEKQSLKTSPKKVINGEHENELIVYGDDDDILKAACSIQRIAKGYLARRRKAFLLSAIGRPAQLEISGAKDFELRDEFNNISKMYCNVRVLKKPFGPFMFQYTTSTVKGRHPEWNDKFFVPALSSKCDLVVTLVGISERTSRRRFLGQGIIKLASGWENITHGSAVPLGKWKFPLDEKIDGIHKFIPGKIEYAIKPLFKGVSVMTGQFLVATNRSVSKTSMWSRVTSLTTSPSTPNTPTSSPSRKHSITRWGVLTDTHLLLFDQGDSNPSISFELNKIQIVQAEAGDETKKPPISPHDVKIYYNGVLHVFQVSSRALQRMWLFKIDLNRRKLMIP